ncbi:MAG: glycerophosphodiester phosphodiesterase [Dehalococcoidia bacterium]
MATPIRFAHRGAPVHPQQENTLAAFEAALRNGAEGLESDVRLTADGVPVLVHGTGRIHGRPLRGVLRSQLSPDIPTLAELWERCGNHFELALDMSDPDAIATVIEIARRQDAVCRLWLTYWQLPRMVLWRRRWPEVKLVYATMLGFPDLVLRRTARNCAAAGVDALNLHHRLISRSSAETVHATGLKLFAWGARLSKDAHRAAALGVDGVFVDDVTGERRD